MVAVAHDGEVLTRAEGFFAERQFAQVLGVLSPWVREHTEDARAWELLSAAHFELKHWREAERAAAQAVRLNPESVRALCNWGAALRKAGRLQEARHTLARALALAPRDSRALVEMAKVARAEEEASPTAPRLLTDEGPVVLLGAGAGGGTSRSSPSARSARPKAALWWAISGCALLVTVAAAFAVSRKVWPPPTRPASPESTTTTVSAPPQQAAPAVQPQVEGQTSAMPATYGYAAAPKAEQPLAREDSRAARLREQQQAQAGRQRQAQQQAAQAQAQREWEAQRQAQQAQAQQRTQGPQAQTAARQYEAPTQASPNWCLLTILANRKGLSAHVVDAATGTTGYDTTMEIIGNPEQAIQRAQTRRPGPRFSTQAYLGDDGMARLWVPTGVELKVELSEMVGIQVGAMQQKTILIPRGTSEYLMQMLY